jgi:hypothetical protein
MDLGQIIGSAQSSKQRCLLKLVEEARKEFRVEANNQKYQYRAMDYPSIFFLPTYRKQLTLY